MQKNNFFGSGWYCDATSTMLNRIVAVQVCDATNVDSNSEMITNKISETKEQVLKNLVTLLNPKLTTTGP